MKMRLYEILAPCFHAHCKLISSGKPACLHRVLDEIPCLGNDKQKKNTSCLNDKRRTSMRCNSPSHGNHGQRI